MDAHGLGYLSDEQSSVAALEYAKIIREMIRHEDDVLDQRFTWLCQIQGFLFAALAFAWKEPAADYLVLLLCLLGSSVAITTWFSLRNVSKGQRILLEWWDRNKPADYSAPDVYVRTVYPQNLWSSKIKYWAPWYILPLIFSLAWLTVFMIFLAF
jgi:hypothetical protein